MERVMVHLQKAVNLFDQFFSHLHYKYLDHEIFHVSAPKAEPRLHKYLTQNTVSRSI